jgi:4-amino-4-deoxy-L-arabinose transferase-like glycosyltransferase
MVSKTSGPTFPSVALLPTPVARPSLSSWTIAGLFALAALAYLWQLGQLPLFDVDEPRYAQCAREMMQRGDWITPYFNGKVRFDKPVLYYWLIALSYQAFGVTEWAARLTSVGATLATAGGLTLFLRRLPYGWASGLVFLTCLMASGIGRMSITDMTLTLWMTLTTLAAIKAVERPRLWLLAGVFAGVGILAKGPVALVLPGLVALLAATVQGQLGQTLRRPWPWLGALLAVVLAAPWYWACYQANGWSFVDALLLHNVTRFEGVVSGHKQPWFFYTLVLLAGSMPWTAYLLGAFTTVWQHRHQTQPSHRMAVIAAVWLVAVFGFFSVAQTKLLTYILPLFPAVSVLVAYQFWHGPRKALRAQTWATGLLVLLVTVAMALGLDKLLPREAHGVEATSAVWWMGAALLAGVVGTDWTLQKSQSRPHALIYTCLGWLLAMSIALIGVLPGISQTAHAPVWFVRQWVALHGPVPVATFHMQRPSLTFYLNQPVPLYMDAKHLTTYAQQQWQTHKALLVLTKTPYVAQVQHALPSCHVHTQTSRYAVLNCQQPAIIP